MASADIISDHLNFLEDLVSKEPDVVLIPYTRIGGREDRTKKFPRIKWKDVGKARAYNNLKKQVAEQNLNYGLRADGLIIVDVDLKDSKLKNKDGAPKITKEEAIKKFEELKKVIPDILKTRTHSTPTGGFHFIFKKNSTTHYSTTALDGYIDLKCGNEGQVVGAGSTIEKFTDPAGREYPGGTYEVVCDDPIAIIPEPLEKWLIKTKEERRNKRKDAKKVQKETKELFTNDLHENHEKIGKLICGNKYFSHLKWNSPGHPMKITKKDKLFKISFGKRCLFDKQTHVHSANEQDNLWITRNNAGRCSHNTDEQIDKICDIKLLDRQFVKELQVLLFGDTWKLVYADGFDTRYIEEKCTRVENSYDIMKQYFERYIMKLINPNCYMKHDKKEMFNFKTGKSEGKKNIYQFFKTNSTLGQAFGELTWWEEVTDSEGNKEWFNDGVHGGGSFIGRWLRDSKKRIYNGLEFSPSTFEPTGMFNQFKGLRITQLYANNEIDCSYTSTEEKAYIKTWNQFQYLFENKKEWDITEMWVANVVCCPELRTRICLILQSYKQQVGKGSLVEFIRRIVGDEVFYKSNNSDSITGKFSHAMRHTLFVNFDEIEFGGSNGIGKFYNQIKGWITEREVEIREMNIGFVTYKNFTNIMMTTNMNNVLPLTKKDKMKYLIFNCVGKIRKECGEDWFDHYYRLLDSPKFLMCIYDYLTKKYYDKLHDNTFSWQKVGMELNTSAWEVYNDTFTPKHIRFLCWLMSGKLGWLQHYWRVGNTGPPTYEIRTWENGTFVKTTNNKDHPFQYNHNHNLVVPLNSRGEKKLGLYNLFLAWVRKYGGKGEGDSNISSNYFSRQLDRLTGDGCKGIQKRKMNQIHYIINPNQIWKYMTDPEQNYAANCDNFDDFANAPNFKDHETIKFSGICMLGEESDEEDNY